MRVVGVTLGNVYGGWMAVEACSACHDVYREKANLADRCTPS